VKQKFKKPTHCISAVPEQRQINIYKYQ